MNDLSQLRKEYTQRSFSPAAAAERPFVQFGLWMQEALDAQIPEPTAMHLATVSAQGRPSGRIVLLKDFDENGFVFYSNYQSRKGKEMATHPFVCLTFHWVEMERQVRIEGKVTPVSRKTSEIYFHSRPRTSQIGAWVSPQSEPVSRDFLDAETQRLTVLYENQEIPLPPHWGGYVVQPDRMEFWQGRPSRLHDRVAYLLQEDSSWIKQRIAP
jgi:pyridoxamine 5'-phosphate oxidase